MNLPEDLYSTLQVAPDADFRAIKTAYFALVRQHPPESDPDAFQRIRAAYEVLSDPERRAAYDADRKHAERHAPEVAAVLRAAEECLGREDHDAARAMLQRLLVEQPALHEARSLLAFVWLRGGNAQQAVAEFRLLVAAEPKQAEHSLHLAWALSEAGQAESALEAARIALSLSPTSGPAAAAVGDILAKLGRKPEALQAWEEGRARAESRIDALELHLRALRLLLSTDPRAARQAFEVLAKDVRAAGDRDLNRLASARVAALAATLYSKGALVPAGNLLDWAGELALERTFEAAPPTRVRIDIEHLPEASRKWVRDAQANGAGPRPPRLFGCIAAASIGAVAAGFTALIVAQADGGEWHAPEWILSWMAWAVSGAAIWYGLRAIPRALRTGRPGAWIAHPLWLVRADRTCVEARPILHLTDVRVTHRQVNGAYAGTNVDLHFGADALTVPFPVQKQAEEWAQSVHDTRQRSLQLLASGLLQTEPGVGLLPPEALASARRQGRNIPAMRSTALQGGGVLAAATVATLIAAMLHPGLREKHSWSSAMTAKQLRQHLRAFPGSPHEIDVRTRLLAIVRERLDTAEKNARHPLPALRPLLDGAPELAGMDIDVSLPKPAGADTDLAQALGGADQHSAGRLRSALIRALGPELLNREAGIRAAAALVLRFTVKDTGEVFRAPGRSDVRAYEVSCDGEFNVGGVKTPLGPWSFAPAMSLTTSERALRANAGAVVREVIEAGRERCERAVLDALAGRQDLVDSRESPLVATAVRSSSPYAHR